MLLLLLYSTKVEAQPAKPRMEPNWYSKLDKAVFSVSGPWAIGFVEAAITCTTHDINPTRGAEYVGQNEHKNAS